MVAFALRAAMKISTLHRHFVIRQIARSKKQAAVFIVCVALSIVTLIALNGFSDSVHSSLLKDARALHAADVIIRSNYDLSAAVTGHVRHLEKQGLANSVRVYEFYSVVRTAENQGSLLANLKVVEHGYPFYGRMVLASGEAFKERLRQGRIIVSQALLDRLGLSVGDRLNVGRAQLTIADVLLQEPAQPVNFFSLGPRVFVSANDLERLDLVKKGSRVRYYCLLKVADPRQINRIAEQLKALADADFVQVDTFRTAESGVKRFFDNFLFFLNLIGIFTLLLAGIGIQSTLSAFLKEKEQTIAILKTIGATSQFFSRHFIIILSLMGLVGTVLGLLSGFILQYFVHVLFAGLLPPNVKLIISAGAMLEGICLGVLVVGLFSFLPLHRLRDIRPVSILRKESFRSAKTAPYFVSVFIIFVFFIGMVMWQISDAQTGFYFIMGIALLILISAAGAQAILFVVRRLNVKPLVIRQALKGLFRPRNATRPIIITLTASLSVIFSIYLLEKNLDATYIESYPPDAPNLFFLDIQPSQLIEFSEALGRRTEYYPIIRAKITAVNGEKIIRKKERQKRGDNLARTFNLTYRNHLLTDEIITEGGALFRKDWGDLQVSVLDTVTEIRNMKIGDHITFKIQGIPITARISSIRSRKRESIRPFFYFVFPEKTLKDAPQTIFTALTVSTSDISELQTRMVQKFPNVSAIDVTETLSRFAQVLRRLSSVIRFFTLFSIIAGILIILSSILATRIARIQEAVYYKILGARSVFVLKVFALENLFLGFVSAGLALIFAQIGSWAICEFLLDISYSPFLTRSFSLIIASVVLIVMIGLLPSSSILRHKPVVFLREQTQE
jgi:putative ABC transport system permease protein